jgi:peptidoglycan/LPS O-acetylase OafA/YrhL
VKTRIAFIDIGRAVGAILVFYSHIAAQWVGKRDEPSSVFHFVNALTSDPMHMSLQGIGEVAVPFFFLVSGFVVTPIALRQGQGRFSLNRLSRVYPPMIFTVLLTALALSLGARLLTTNQLITINVWTVFTNSLLVNYLMYPQVVLVGVAWTLVVEMIFYIVLVLLIPVLRRAVWLALAIELTFVFVVLMSRSQFGPSWSLFAVNVSYLPIPVIGQVIWATVFKRIPTWLGGVYVGVAWSLYVLGDLLKIGRVDSSYSLALAFALICFLMGLFAEPRLKQRTFWTALSERSYSLYLLHGLVAFALLDLMRPTVPLLIAVVIAVVATFGVVELSFRFVELPSHRLARRLSRKPAPVAEPEPEPVGEEHDDEDEDEFDEDFHEEEELDSAALLAAEVTTELPNVREPVRHPAVLPPPSGNAGPIRPAGLRRRPARPAEMPRNGHDPEESRRSGQLLEQAEESTRHVQPVYPADDEDEPPTRRRHRDDNAHTVSVASLLANHAKERANRS